MIVLRLENVTARQGNFQLQIPQWDVEQGEFHALLGRNGAGKSTLLRVIAGDLPCSGSIRLHGRSLHNLADLDRARHLAVLPQASELNFTFRAEDVVALGAMPLTMNRLELQLAVQEAMASAQCRDLCGAPYPQLSGGEKQRIHFARVLLQLSQSVRSPVLLLDEPTAAQDLRQQHQILSRTRSLVRDEGYTVVAVLHDLNQALRYTDRCTLLEGGAIAQHGAPDTVLTPENVTRHWDYAAAYAFTDAGDRLLC